MSRSPYNAYANRPSSSSKNSPLRQSAPVPADGALSGDGSGGWGLNSMLRNSVHVTPRPPSSEPNPPAVPNSNGAAKSPMAFRARRFNNTGSGSDNDLTVSASGASSSGAVSSLAANLSDSGRRISSETTPISPASSLPSTPAAATTSTATIISPTSASSPPQHPTSNGLVRQLSSGSASSSSSVRPTVAPSATILAAFSNGSQQSLHASLDTLSMQGGGVVVGSPGKALRPKSSETNLSMGSGASSTTASTTGSKVLRTRLSEDAGGHAAGAPTLSLREKLAILQRNNKALEQQLAEAANEAQQRAAAQHEAHLAAMSALQQRVAALEGQVTQQQRMASELTQRNSQLTTAQQKLTTQLSDARRVAAEATAAAAAAAAAAPAAPAVASGAAGSGKSSEQGADGPLSPRTPLSRDGLPATTNASPSTATSTTATSTGPSAPLSGTSAATSAPSPAGDLSPHHLDSAAANLLVLSHSELDFPQASHSSPNSTSSGGLAPTRSALSGSGSSSAAAVALGSDIYLTGSGPPPASPVAAAAGLSGAGVALLARQKKVIATLRMQLQQKDSAYAFLANEHSELEGQLKEVEASKREYAARYAFMVLDQDLDGHIRVDQVPSFDMFGCYSAAVLEYAFKHWRFASGFKGYLNMEDFVRFVTLSDDRASRDAQRFWFAVLDVDGDGAVSAEDAKWFYDAVDKDESTFVVSFEDLWNQLLDMTQPTHPRRGFTAAELWKCKLGAGVIGLLLNHNNMLLHRTTAEWGRGDFPL